MSEEPFKGNAFRRSIGQAAMPAPAPAADSAPEDNAKLAQIGGTIARAFAKTLAERRNAASSQVSNAPQSDEPSSAPLVARNPLRRKSNVAEVVSHPAPDQGARIEWLRNKLVAFTKALAKRRAPEADQADDAPQTGEPSPAPSIARNPLRRNKSTVAEAAADPVPNQDAHREWLRSKLDAFAKTFAKRRDAGPDQADDAPQTGEPSPAPSIARNPLRRNKSTAAETASDSALDQDTLGERMRRKLGRAFARAKHQPDEQEDATSRPAFSKVDAASPMGETPPVEDVPTVDETAKIDEARIAARKPFWRAKRPDMSQDTPPVSSARSLMGQLQRQLGGAFAYAGLLTLFINVAMLFVPLYSMIIFDRVMQSKSYDTLTMLSIVCVVGMILYGSLEFCRSMIFIAIADKLTRGLNISTLRASIARSLSGEPTAAAQAVRDLDSLRTFASGQSPIVSLDLIWTPIVLLVLYMLHPWYGHYGLICAGVLFLLSIANDLTTRESLVEANNAAAASLSDLSAALRQRELIDGLGMLPEIARHWMRQQNKVLAQAALVSRRGTRFAVAAKTARLGMQGLGIAVGVILVIHHQASPGSLIGASILLGKLLLPFEQLLSAWRQWIAALASWRRLSDLLDRTPVRIGHAKADTVEGRLVLDQVSFTPATGGAPIIENLSLTIEPGEVVAVVGPSGAGKSTLARLVMGILPPTSGRITLDGIPTVEWDRTELAHHVGYLAQSVGLLDGTILDNIARMDAADPAAAIEAASRAGVHDLVGRLRDGYGTQVGDSGQALSGGTRQRIALARALYGHPKLIVLDEPNANLDHDGEQALVRVIHQVRDAGIAVLLITHRPSILAAVDRIVGVEKGRITRIEHASAQSQLTNPGRAMAQAAG